MTPGSPVRLLGHASCSVRPRSRDELARHAAARGRVAGRRGRERSSRIVARMGWFRFAILLIALLAAGCGRVTDSEQLRLCRLILPVLHAEGTEIRGNPRLRRAAGPACASTTRHASRAPRGARTSLACGFGGATFERDRLDLVAVETDGGRSGEARLLFLKRYLAEAGREVAPLRRGAAATPRRRGLCAAAADQRARARGGLRAARHRLFADLRPGRADQSRVRRDRGARRLRGDRRGHGGGRARHRRPDRLARAGARDRGGARGRLEHAGRPRRGRAAARAPPARPADPDRDRGGRALDQRIRAHHPGLARALVAAGVQSADRAWRARRTSSSP